MPYPPAGQLNNYGDGMLEAAMMGSATAVNSNYQAGIDYGLGNYTAVTIHDVQGYTGNYYVTGVSNYIAGAMYGTNQVFTTGNITYHVYEAPPMTPEQIAEAAARAAEFEAERKLVDAKARETLERVLNDRQLEDFKRFSWFDVEVKGRVYRIKPGRKVEKLDPETKELVSFHCIHPEDCLLPADDIAVSQKLWLEANESEFLRIANETRP